MDTIVVSVFHGIRSPVNAIESMALRNRLYEVGGLGGRDWKRLDGLLGGEASGPAQRLVRE
jgi:hypothetical protein